MTSPATSIDLREKYGNTNLSNYEVWMMGESFWTWLAIPGRMGWASPASALDYTTNSQALGLPGLIMRDFVAWTCGRTNLVEEGVEGRLAELVENADLDRHLSLRIGQVLGGAA